MAFHLSGYTLLYASAFSVSALAAFFAFRIRRAPGGSWFFFMTIATAVWSLADAFDYSSVTLEAHVTAAQFAYFGSTAPVLFLLFALQYSGRMRGAMGWRTTLLFVVPLVSIAAAFTNSYHHLLWRGFTVLADRPNMIVYQHGPVYWVVTVYSLVLALVATLLLLDVAVKARGIYRTQGVAIVVAAIFPWVGGVVYSVAPEWFLGLDPALTLTVTGVILAWSMWRLKLLDLVLVPREVIVEQMADGLIVLDSAMRILEINPAAVRLLGLASTPAPGTPALEVLANWSESGWDALTAVYKQRASTLASPTGAFLRVDRSLLESGGDGQARDLFTLRDITAQVEAERALKGAYAELAGYRDQLEALVEERTAELTRANDELRAATRTKDDFFAAMSHELRTPLNSILGFSGVVLSGMAGEINEEQRKQLMMVRRSGRHLLNLINDLLDLTRLEATGMPPEAVDFELDEVLDIVAKMIAPQADEKGIGIEIAVPAPGTSMRTDRVQLEQILLNIVGNGVKFSSGGTVRLSTSCSGEWVTIAVSDEGPGIPEASQVTIFEEFQQLARPETGKPQGTGLGLAISRRLARGLGGDITVQSAPGEGSTFSVVVPRWLRERPDAESRPAEPA